MMHPITFYHHAENYNLLETGFRQNVHKAQFFSKFPLGYFVTLLTPNFMQNVRKTIGSLRDIQRKTNRRLGAKNNF